MPLRIFGYEGASYRSQLLNKKKSPIPVVTLILYFGTKRHWNYSRNLKSVLTIPNGMEDYVDEVLKLLSAMTGDARYEKILAMPEKGQVSNMCEIGERLEKRFEIRPENVK